MTAASAPAAGLARLRAAAASGQLEEVCRRHRIRVLTVFGSVLDDPANARDLDVAVLFEPTTQPHLVALVDTLMEIAGLSAVDVMDVARAPAVARARALVGTEALFESEPGAYAEAAVAAMKLEWDTAWLRRLALESLAR